RTGFLQDRLQRTTILNTRTMFSHSSIRNKCNCNIISSNNNSNNNNSSISTVSRLAFIRIMYNSLNIRSTRPRPRHTSNNLTRSIYLTHINQ
ncbi:hypothetical protein BGZ75_000673, partial [Mortierella antarctica]